MLSSPSSQLAGSGLGPPEMAGMASTADPRGAECGKEPRLGAAGEAWICLIFESQTTKKIKTTPGFSTSGICWEFFRKHQTNPKSKASAAQSVATGDRGGSRAWKMGSA